MSRQLAVVSGSGGVRFSTLRNFQAGSVLVTWLMNQGNDGFKSAYERPVPALYSHANSSSLR